MAEDDFYKNSDNLVDYSNWLSQARVYSRQCKKLEKVFDENESIDILPIIVLKAFALESYLKAFIVLYKGEIKLTHDLLELFGELPNHVKNSLSSMYINSYSNNKLTKDLKKCCEYFVEIRYLISSPRNISIYSNQLQDICDLCEEFIRKKLTAEISYELCTDSEGLSYLKRKF